MISWKHFGSQNAAKPLTLREMNPQAPAQPFGNISLPQAIQPTSPPGAFAEQLNPATQEFEELRNVRELGRQTNTGGREAKTHVGEKIGLPPLSRETLLRKEAEGSSRLMVGPFRSLLEAQKFQQKVQARGFNAKVTPRRVSAKIFLYRVEIAGLQDLAARDRAWNLLDIQDVSAEP